MALSLYCYNRIEPKQCNSRSKGCQSLLRLFKLFCFKELIAKVVFSLTFCCTSKCDDERLANISVIYTRFFFFFLVSLTFLWSTHEKRKSEQHIKNITHRKTFEYCSMQTGTNLTNHIYYYWASHSRYIFLFS